MLPRKPEINGWALSERWATVGSGIHASYLKELDPEITVIGKACPLFVPLVEEGWYHDPVTEEVARRYLKELQEQEIDTLILGCTHYPLLRSTIARSWVRRSAL